MPYLISGVLPPGALARTAQPTITGDGLVLRPWRAADAPAVYEAFQDPALRQWHIRGADSEDEVRGWIAEWVRSWRGERQAQWAVVDPGTGALLGRVALRNMLLGDGAAEVAYWTVAAARGRGVAPRGVTALVHWAFGVGFHRLELTHSVRNEASCRVATKTGFALEGTKRSALLHPDGWHDMHLHARVEGHPA
ncbi:GNAT family N-acetyltransferase [Streptomyces sp. NPDC003328]|uniref:GNAT family N-acetyltransferase n=1 Tax=Streptomyces lannensis TaxID=766498 RepID=A0ABP7KGX5_9ACTN|nr:N-acetyltransferase [Streptomyces sp. T1317-0309]